VLTYAQQSKEQANIEQDKLAKRIQEYRTQAELENIRASSSNTEPMSGADGSRPLGLKPYKSFEAGMQSATKGEASNWCLPVNMWWFYSSRHMAFYFYFDVLFRLVV